MATKPDAVADWSGLHAASDWSRALTSAVRGATQVWSQPILPGWTLNVNSNNSSAPQTEADVVHEYSYGKQLGRISDALAALIQTLPKTQQGGPAFEPFTEMKKDIDKLKLDAAQKRVERIEADLMQLKAERPEEYARVRAALRRALDR